MTAFSIHSFRQSPKSTPAVAVFSRAVLAHTTCAGGYLPAEPSALFLEIDPHYKEDNAEERHNP